jgi:RecJ-like exonuclease
MENTKVVKMLCVECNNEVQQMRCERCNGTGDAGIDNGEVDWDYYPCPECDGRGGHYHCEVCSKIVEAVLNIVEVK